LTKTFIKLVLLKESPTFELWLFAARNSFEELEQYCRENEEVWKQISSVLCDPRKGVGYFIRHGIPDSLITQLTCGLLKQCQDLSDRNAKNIDDLSKTMMTLKSEVDGFKCRATEIANEFKLRNEDLVWHVQSLRQYFRHIRKSGFVGLLGRISC
jgi:hypothetical protein